MEAVNVRYITRCDVRLTVCN